MFFKHLVSWEKGDTDDKWERIRAGSCICLIWEIHLFAKTEIITGNAWSLSVENTERRQWMKSQWHHALGPIHGWISCACRVADCPSWGGWCWLLPRTHPSAAEAYRNPSLVVFSCHGKERRLLASQWAAGEAVWVVWPLVAGFTCWCQPGITGDLWNQECYLSNGCFSCQSSALQPGVLAEITCEVREGVNFSASERAFSTHKVNLAFSSLVFYFLSAIFL